MKINWNTYILCDKIIVLLKIHVAAKFLVDRLEDSLCYYGTNLRKRTKTPFLNLLCSDTDQWEIQECSSSCSSEYESHKNFCCYSTRGPPWHQCGPCTGACWRWKSCCIPCHQIQRLHTLSAKQWTGQKVLLGSYSDLKIITP